MNKNFQFSLAIIIAAIVGACCSTAPVNCGSATDAFCINMKSGDEGRDVKNWQCFLLEKRFGHTIPNGTFGKETEDATKLFQSSRCYRGTQDVLVTGTVTFATYSKAVRAGMPKYNLKKPSECSRTRRRSHMMGGVQARTIGTYEAFYTPMKYECKDVTGDLEVTDWQAILQCLGYTVGNPGDYDTSTQGATGDFQSDASLIGVAGVKTGIVDYKHTFVTAYNDCPCTVHLKVYDGAGCSTSSGGSGGTLEPIPPH